jgi:hypothetical protein
MMMRGRGSAKWREGETLLDCTKSLDPAPLRGGFTDKDWLKRRKGHEEMDLLP